MSVEPRPLPASADPGDGRPLPEDDVDRLLHDCLSLPAEAWEDAVGEVCRGHPSLAPEVRRRFQILREAGLLDEERSAGAEFPERLGGFRLLERLGGGGMGVVYLAEQEDLRRHVALKLVRPEQLYFPGSKERFRREVEAVARLNHPGIVPVHAVGEEKGIPFFAMERIEGCTLDEALQALAGTKPPEKLGGPDLAAAVAGRVRGGAAAPDEREAVRLFGGSWTEVCFRLAARIAEALAHAHARGVIHRDVKPSNVMVTPEGRVMLTDFGLASMEGTSKLTRSGSLVGSLPYMSPEQLREGPEGIDHRTDVYSLGVTLYELLTLGSPFLGASSEDTRRRILHGAPPVRSRNRAVSQEAETVCGKAMDPDPGRRYATMAACAEDLRAFLEYRPISARRASTVTKVRHWARREPLRAALVLVLGLSVPAVAGLTGWFVAQQSVLAAGREKLRADELEGALTGGYLLVSEGDLEAAITAFAGVLRTDPGNAEALVGIVGAMTRLHRTADAMELVDGTAPTVRNGLVLERLRVHLLAASGKTTEAKELEERLPAPSLPLEFFLLGCHELARASAAGDREGIDQATRLLSTAALASPGARILFHTQLAKAAGRGSDAAAARSAARALETLWPRSSIAWNYIAMALDRHDLGKAIAAYERAVELDPGAAIAHSNLGLAYARSGNPRKAADAFRRSLAVNPDNAKIHTNLARSLLDLGDAAGAEAACRAALAADPRYFMAENNLALAQKRLGKRAEAKEAFRRALAINPRYAVGWSNFANMVREDGDLPGAVDAYRRAVQADPRYVRGWINLGQALELLEPGPRGGALEAYRRALALEPQDPDTVLTLGKRLVDLGDLAAALAACARATEIAPGLPAAWRELACVLMHPDCEPKIRDASRALAAARKAVDLSGGSDPAMLDTLAHAESAAGDHDAAVRTAGKAVAAAAADPERKEETVRLQASLDRLRSAASRPAAR